MSAINQGKYFNRSNSHTIPIPIVGWHLQLSYNVLIHNLKEWIWCSYFTRSWIVIASLSRLAVRPSLFCLTVDTLCTVTCLTCSSLQVTLIHIL